MLPLLVLGATLTIVPPGDHNLECGSISNQRARKLEHQQLVVGTATISAKGHAMEILARAKWMRGVRTLHVCTDDRGLRALAKVDWAHLRTLELYRGDGETFDPEAVRAMLSSRRLRRLSRLRFVGFDLEGDYSLSSDGFAVLADAELPALRSLDVSYNHGTPEAFEDLVRSPLAHQVTELNLCWTSADVGVVIDAALTNLARLCLSPYDMIYGLSDADRARIDAAYPGILAPEPYGFEDPHSDWRWP